MDHPVFANFSIIVYTFTDCSEGSVGPKLSEQFSALGSTQLLSPDPDFLA